MYLIAIIFFFVFCFLFIFFELKYHRKLKLFFRTKYSFKRNLNKNIFLKRFLKKIFLFLAIVCFLIALIRPKIFKNNYFINKKKADIIFLLDVSNSMLSQDISPDRLEKSKFLINKILNHLKENDRVCLIPFAGNAYIQCPLTTNIHSFKKSLNQIDNYSISFQGTNLNQGLKKLIEILKEKELTNKIVLIFSDGEEVKRFQADISFKMSATKNEIQDFIDELIISQF